MLDPHRTIALCARMAAFVPKNARSIQVERGAIYVREGMQGGYRVGKCAPYSAERTQPPCKAVAKTNGRHPCIYVSGPVHKIKGVGREVCYIMDHVAN